MAVGRESHVEQIVKGIRAKIAQESQPAAQVVASPSSAPIQRPAFVPLHLDAHAAELRRKMVSLTVLGNTLSATAEKIGDCPPTPPTFRGRFSARIIRTLGSLLWWYTLYIKECIFSLLRQSREQQAALESSQKLFGDAVSRCISSNFEGQQRYADGLASSIQALAGVPFEIEKLKSAQALTDVATQALPERITEATLAQVNPALEAVNAALQRMTAEQEKLAARLAIAEDRSAERNQIAALEAAITAIRESRSREQIRFIGLASELKALTEARNEDRAQLTEVASRAEQLAKDIVEERKNLLPLRSDIAQLKAEQKVLPQFSEEIGKLNQNQAVLLPLGEEVSKLKQSLLPMVEDVALLQAGLAEIRPLAVEVNKLSDGLRALQPVTGAVAQLQTGLAEIRPLVAEIEKLKDGLGALQPVTGEVARLQAAQAAMTAEAKAWKEDLQSALHPLSEDVARVKSAQEQIKPLAAEVTRQQGWLQSLQPVAEQVARLQSAHESLLPLAAEVAQLKSGQTATASLAAQVAATREGLDVLEPQIESIKQHLYDWRPLAQDVAQLMEERGTIRSIADGVESLRQAYHADQQRLTELAVNLSAMQAKSTQFRQWLDNIQADLEGQKQTRSSDAALLQEQLGMFEETQQSSAKAVETIAVRLERLENVFRQLDAVQNTFSETIAHSQRVLPNRISEIEAHIHSGLAELEQRIQELHGKTAEKGELELLRSRVEAAQSAEETVALQKELNRIVDSYRHLEGRLGDLGLAYAKLRAEVLVLQSRNSQLTQKLFSTVQEAGKEVAQIEGPAAAEDFSYDRIYLEFENAFRGPRDEIMARQRAHLPLIKQAGAGGKDGTILDLGCGRGEWLELLRQEGYEAYGIDKNHAMLEMCHGLGLKVSSADALTFLRSLPDRSHGAITSFHMIEHMPFPALLALIDESLRVLRPGGLLMLETPNPGNIAVGASSFHMDPTHVRPVPHQLLKFFVEARGFFDVQVREIHPFPSIALVPDDSPAARRLNECFYGPQDYCLSARRP